MSITSLDNTLKTSLEPRAAAPAARLRCVRELSAAGIPVSVLMAPVIPGVNDEEIEDIAAASAAAGACSIGYVVLRLPYEVKDLFREWLDTHVPEKAARVMSSLATCAAAKTTTRNGANGRRAQGRSRTCCARRFELARQRNGLDGARMSQLSTDLFRDPNCGEPERHCSVDEASGDDGSRSRIGATIIAPNANQKRSTTS